MFYTGWKNRLYFTLGYLANQSGTKGGIYIIIYTKKSPTLIIAFYTQACLGIKTVVLMRTVMQTNHMPTLRPSQRTVSHSARHSVAEWDWACHTHTEKQLVKLNKLEESKEVNLREWGYREGNTWLLIGCFTGVDPVTVNIHWFRQIGYRGLELLQANTTRYYSCVASSFHFDIAGLLMVTKRASELDIQVASHFLLGGRLSLWLSAPHL